MKRYQLIIVSALLGAMALTGAYAMGKQAGEETSALMNDQWFRAGAEDAVQNIAIGACSHLDGWDYSDCLTRLYDVSVRLYNKGKEDAGDEQATD